VKHHINTCPQNQSLPGITGGTGQSLTKRYGAAVLADGYVAVPRLLIRQRRALGISPGEWLYILELFGYWRTDGDPYPGVERLAADLGVDASTVRRYRLSLEARGLLRVYREGRHNRYDLRPLLAASVALEHEAAPIACDPAAAHRAPLHTEEEQDLNKNHDQDKTPYPQEQLDEHPDRGSDVEPRPVHGTVAAGGTEENSAQLEAPAAITTAGAGDLAARLAAIGAELGDDTPASSLTRALNLEREIDVSRDRLLAAVEVAARRVHDCAPTFRILGADGRPNGMHYFFGVLRRQLRGAPCRSRARPGTAPARLEAAPPVPIAEAHPVWRAALEELRREMPAQTFAIWLAPTRVLDQAGAVLRVAVPKPLHKLWLERIAGRIAEALGRTGHAGLCVEYVVHAA
jgi:DNA-binding MarR family transcriptional regulator